MITRKIDKLGRLVLPVEMRKQLGWLSDSTIVINCDGKTVSLMPYDKACCICGEKNNLSSIKNKFICKDCLIQTKSVPL